MEVYLTEVKIFTDFLYFVHVDEVRYDKFMSSRQLTWAEQRDVASYYREALTQMGET